MRWLVLLLLVAAEPSGPIEFKAGQHWSYDTRPQDPESTLVIGRVEDLPKLGTVVHISVVDVNIAQPGSIDVGHAPAKPAAQFEDGYKAWLEAKGGVFTISVREGVEFVEQTLKRGS